MVFAKLFNRNEARREENGAVVETKTTGRKRQSESTQNESSTRGNKKRRPRKKRKVEGRDQEGEIAPEQRRHNVPKSNHAVTEDSPATRPAKAARSGPPSQAAMALSTKLKECSTNKRLKEALDLYWDISNDSIRDIHHACIVVDCSARCGAIHEGEKIVKDMINKGVPINIETNTALLKGYAHAGLMHMGASLFQKMCRGKGRNRPNVRTLNTLLRGCLWTAASVGVGDDGKPNVAGGVVTAREAWSLCVECGPEAFDSSSYEYYIALLCYSLHIEEAEAKIDEFKLRYNVTSKSKQGTTNTYICDDPSYLETLAISLLNLSRAQGVIGEFSKAKLSAHLAICVADSLSSTADNKQVDNNSSSKKQNPQGKVHGGKRAWREDAGGSRRSESNTLFRSHRMSEIKAEAKWINDVCEKRYSEVGIFTKSIATRLFYFSGGGTTGLVPSDTKAERTNQTNVLNTSWLSFGLKESFRAKSLNTMIGLSKMALLDTSSCKSIFEVLGVGNNPVLDKKGFLHVPVIFRDAPLQDREQGAPQQRRKLNVELGAGFGDWIAEQARLNPHDNYISVEMRSDRVAQTFAKAVLSIPELKNLSCVGAEGGSFLRERLRPGTVSTIFVNHPEPPTQTYGAQDTILESIADGRGEEPAHMLASETLRSALACLELMGKLVIVTDNRFYARLICATTVRTLLSHTSPANFKSMSLNGFTEVERFGAGDCVVHLYEGSPSEEIGHAVDPHGGGGGTSYFDRLWRTGAGNHAERSKRFVVIIERGLPKRQEMNAVPNLSAVKNTTKKRKFRVREERRQ